VDTRNVETTTVEPPKSAYGRWSLTRAKTILGQNFASLLAYGNSRDLPNVLNALLMSKVTFEKKYCACHWEISVSCTIQYCAIVGTAYYPIFALLPVKWSLTGGWKKEKFKLLALKVVAVAHERWSLTRGSKYSDLTRKLLVFWKTGRLREVVATRSKACMNYFFVN